jgi:ankyrin repeat protein
MDDSVTAFQTALTAGAAVNIRGRYNLTSLHEAAAHGYADIAPVLLELSADPAAKNARRQTPLHWAVAYDHPDLLTLLQ